MERTTAVVLFFMLKTGKTSKKRKRFRKNFPKQKNSAIIKTSERT